MSLGSILFAALPILCFVALLCLYAYVRSKMKDK